MYLSTLCAFSGGVRMNEYIPKSLWSEWGNNARSSVRLLSQCAFVVRTANKVKGTCNLDTGLDRKTHFSALLASSQIPFQRLRRNIQR